MDAVQKCKAHWMAANSDTERFAALFIVIKVLKSASLTEAERKDVFETIGFSFLKRLLSSDVPADCPPSILKAVSLSILACFCTDEDIAAKNEVYSLISPIIDILKDNLSVPGDKPLVNDALCCLAGMAKHKKCLKKMLDRGAFPVLVKLYISDNFEQSKVFGILMDLVIQIELGLDEENQNLLNDLMANMCIQFSDETTEKKFELGELILFILLKYPDFSLQRSTAAKIRDTLTNLMQNKLGKKHRDVTIKLAGLMMNKFSTEWFAEEDVNCKRFFVLLVQITCVEIRMLLEDKSVSDIQGDAFLLTACYRIVECVIQTMVSDNWFQSNRTYADPLLNSMKCAMSAVIQFLNTASAEHPDICESETVGSQNMKPVERILLATIRVLCSWMAEESLVLQSEICEILPFVLKMCKKWTQDMQSEENLEVIPMRFLMAPLCHLTADNIYRKVLLDNGLITLLWEYFSQQWQKFSASQGNPEFENVLLTMCGIFLNIVVLEPQLVADSEQFFLLLKLLLNAFSDLIYASFSIMLSANFSVLGLLITKQCYKKIEARETMFYCMLSQSIKFLWDVHHVQEQNNVNVFVIPLPYQEIWTDLMELWFLGMQALSSLLPLLPWIAEFVLQSGWPGILIEGLSIVSPNGIEGNIKYTFEALLSSLVRIDKKAGEILMTQNALAVCRKHKMKELESLLLPLV